MTDVHHENPNTYADSWEDCLVVAGESIKNAQNAASYGAPEGATLVALSDWTDGPHTRVKFFASIDDWILTDQFPEGAEFRLKPSETGEFAVTKHEATQNDIYKYVELRVPDVTMCDVAVVDKYVPVELADELFPVGRRFTLEPLAR